MTPPDPMTSGSMTSGALLTVHTVSPSVLLLTLHNQSTEPMGYNLCTSVLEQRRGSSWSPAGPSAICTMELRTLAPGETATFEKTLPQDFDPGAYRYITNVEIPLGTRAVGVTSDPFGIG